MSCQCSGVLPITKTDEPICLCFVDCYKFPGVKTPVKLGLLNREFVACCREKKKQPCYDCPLKVEGSI